jgi:hypothetical protein
MKVGDIGILKVVNSESLPHFFSILYYLLSFSQLIQARCNVRSILLVCVNLAAATINSSNDLSETSTVVILGVVETSYCALVIAITELVYTPFDLVIWVIVGVTIGLKLVY